MYTCLLPYESATSPLGLAVLHGLYSYAQEVISDKKHLGWLFHWAYLGANIHDPYDSGPSLRQKRIQFLSLLLKHGANPNTKITIHYIISAESRKAEQEVEAEEGTEDGDPESVIADEEAQVVEEAEKDRKLKDIYSSDRIEERVELPPTNHETDTATSSSSPKPSTPNLVLNEGDMEMSVLHFALCFCTYQPNTGEGGAALLDAIGLLVNYGADVNEKSLRTLPLPYTSGHRQAPESQSALHYLIHQSSPQSNLFKYSQSGPSRSRLIKVFLEHGADPNAIDSDGLTVLECALPTCRYDVTELMLEKGAKITPRLVLKSGAPKHHSKCYFRDQTDSDSENAGHRDYLISVSEFGNNLELPYISAGDILNEMRWRRPECYTDEARELARPHNQHWAESEHVERKTATLSFASRFRARVGLN
jgi:hypothetical protein